MIINNPQSVFDFWKLYRNLIYLLTIVCLFLLIFIILFYGKTKGV
jgi:hypothetical protein